MGTPRDTNAPASGTSGPAPLHAAFRELHGARLQGFALLLTLGDRQMASEAAAEALLTAGPRLGELRHPERAAAWLRASVFRTLRRRGAGRKRFDEGAYQAALRDLGVEIPVALSLARLSLVERAALVAADVERLEPRDVATVIAMSNRATARILQQARRAFLGDYAAPGQGAEQATLPHALDGPRGRRLRDVAARTMAFSQERW